MNKQDLIMDFIDGKIDPEDKDILFEHLFYDEAAREEFIQQIQILLKLNQAFKPLPVPSYVTNNIYHTLGIKQSSLINLWQNVVQSRYTKFGLALALFLLITLSSFYFGQLYNQYKLMGQNEITHSSMNNFPLVSSSEMYFDNLHSNTTNMNTKTQLNQSNIKYNHNYLISLANYSILLNSIDNYYKNQYSNQSNTTNFQSITSNHLQNSSTNETNEKQILSKEKATPNTFNPLSFSNSSTAKITNLPSNLVYSTQNNPVNTTLSLNDLISPLLPTDYRFEINLLNIITQTATPNGLKTTGINQFDFNTLYYLNSSNAIGLNVGYENFPQEFTRTIQGKQFLQIQSPNLLYMGISYRYNYFQVPFGGAFIPYFDLTIGGTQVGPIIKGQIGANIPVWNLIALNIGLHNSMLIYNVENKIYSTNKFNFVYGLNIKL